MIDTAVLYQEAKEQNIPIFLLDIPENGSMCVQTEQQCCYIGLDYGVMDCEADCRVHLAHELGHCITGAFYNRWAARDIREKHEHRADKWAIERTIPETELDQAIAEGDTNLWSLAERFNVTEDFMRKAICWYYCGNLNTDLYF